jgi:protein-tyrosine phosphatase
MTTQVLIPGTHNSRDLGGIGAQGGVIRPRTMVRSDAPANLGASGRSAIRALGIRSAIDLREPVEIDLDPPDLDGTGVEVYNRPILGESFHRVRDVSLAEIYRVLLAERGGQLVEVVRQLAAPGTLPAIVFCSAGKDRTGLVSMLTLAAAGATENGIVADYAATERNMAEAFREKLMRRALAAGITEQEAAVKVGSPPALMRETLEWLRENHGGTEAFLRSHGMTDAEFETLRTALVVPRAAAQAA